MTPPKRTAKKAAKKAAKAPAKKAPAKKAPARKAPARKAPARKAPARKAPARKAPAKKAPAKKAPAKKAPARGKPKAKGATAALLVSKSRTKDYLKAKGQRSGDDVIAALNAEVLKMLDGASSRAQGNGRRTVRPVDF